MKNRAMNVQAIPAHLREYGFAKTVSAVQTIFDADLVNEVEARELLKRVRAMYCATMRSDEDVFVYDESGVCDFPDVRGIALH